jgi:two-component system, OmpR family, phosphate regulon sensor histidine kinase PhoR
MGFELIAVFLSGAVCATAVAWARLRLGRLRRLRMEASLDRARTEMVAKSREVDLLRQLFDAVLGSFPRPVFITDHNRIILFANNAALELAQQPRDQVIHRLLATVVQDYDTTRLLVEAAQSGQPRDRTFLRAATRQTWRVAVTPLGLATFPPDASPSARRPSDISHLILTIEDLTELKRLETVRQDFVSHVSHELRTPLAALQLQAETLAGAIETDPPAARAFAERIGGEVNHLTQMVSELLELSRIESGKVRLRLEPTDVAGLVETVLDRMRPLADQRGVALRMAIPADLPLALADGKRIGEVLVNLVDNGIKYTPPEGTITVTAEAVPGASAKEEDGTPPPGDIIVRVADTGVGISDEDLPRVFERFFKVDRARTRASDEARGMGGAQARAAAGTGLGLAIARHLVELHGGRIWAESRLGRGSAFSFAVPAAREGDIAEADGTELEEDASLTVAP